MYTAWDGKMSSNCRLEYLKSFAIYASPGTSMSNALRSRRCSCAQLLYPLIKVWQWMGHKQDTPGFVSTESDGAVNPPVLIQPRSLSPSVNSLGAQSKSGPSPIEGLHAN